MGQFCPWITSSSVLKILTPLGFCCAVKYATERLQLCTGSCWIIQTTASKTTLAEGGSTPTAGRVRVQCHKACFQAVLASFLLNINSEKSFRECYSQAGCLRSIDTRAHLIPSITSFTCGPNFSSENCKELYQS